MNTHCLVTTTIQPPTRATHKLLAYKNWDFIIAGDTLTPHEQYRHLEKCHTNLKYLQPYEQTALHSKLSLAIGWRSIRRRNMAFFYAYKQKRYDVVGTFDDDNIFNDAWDGTTLVGKSMATKSFSCDGPVMDPFRPLNIPYHHRGFPLTLIRDHRDECVVSELKEYIVDVDAPIPEGDPDIDAITRIMQQPTLALSQSQKDQLPFTSDNIMPFNSQCTFLRASLLPFYMMIPHIGRYDDIFGAYLLQKLKDVNVVFNKPIAIQERNEHDLTHDLKDEVYGYCNAEKFVKAHVDDVYNILPKKAAYALTTYMKAMRNLR
tara:strand:+ start:6243 stop:7196 length:954 start_codon:yes stop_codon:yes gene_type:complete